MENQFLVAGDVGWREPYKRTSFISWLPKMESLGETEERYTGPLCTIFPTLCDPFKFFLKDIRVQFNI